MRRWRLWLTAGTSVSSRAVRVARWFEPIRGGSATTATRVAGYADGGTSGGRQALDVGSHHQPLSHASGCAATPSGRHTLAVGSHHWPLPQSSGCGPTPSGRQTSPVGSHHWPGSHCSASGASAGRHMLAFGSHHQPFAHCAELTAGVTAIAKAIGAIAITTTTAKRRTTFCTACLPGVLGPLH
ncbi:hypothetical protein I552_5516 [Mycobacterium xenopi 3993]|nr:hypothetical protein I552_5516 [Mycobacterium xenopi 3993]